MTIDFEPDEPAAATATAQIDFEPDEPSAAPTIDFEPDEPVQAAAPVTPPEPPNERGIISGALAGLGRGAAGIVADMGGFIAGPVRQLAATQTGGISEAIGEGAIFDRIGAALRSTGEAVGRTEALQPSTSVQTGGVFNPGNWRWWTERSTEFVPQLAAQLGLAVATKSPAAFMTTGGAQMAGNTYNEAIDDFTKKGDTSETARQRAALEAGVVGAVGAFIEKIPGAEFLTKGGAISTALQTVLRNRFAVRGVAGFAAEGTEELLQEISTDLAAIGFRDDAERLKDAGSRYAASFVLGGLPGTGVGMLTGDRDIAPEAPEVQTAQLEKAVEAEAQAILTESPEEVIAEAERATGAPEAVIPAETTAPAPAATESAVPEPVSEAAPPQPEVAPQTEGEVASPEVVAEPAEVVTSEVSSEVSPEVVGPAAETETAIEPAPVESSPESVNPEQSSEPPPLPPPPLPDNQPSPTGIRNEIVDQERVRRGLPERMAPLRRTFGRIWDEAMRRADVDAQAGAKLVASIAQNPRPLEDWESALLAHEQVTRETSYEEAVDAVNNATDDMRADASARLEAERAAIQEVYDVGQAAGTKSGQSLAARKLLVNRDYTLARMEAETRAVANQGKPLTAQQHAEVKVLHDRIKTLEGKLAEVETREQQQAAQTTFNELMREMKRERSAAVKRGKSLTDFLDDQAAKARERIAGRRGRLLSTVDPLNVAGLVDEAIVGASYIAKGIVKLSDWSARMIADFGERIRPVIDDLFSKSKAFYDANEKLFSAAEPVQTPADVLAKVQPGAALSQKVVFDLARAHVRAGMSGMDEVMAAVQADLAPLIEGVTVRDVRDAFSGYGKTQFPSKAEDLKKLREYRRLAQLASAIEDAQKKQPPKKSGMQRDEPTQAIREKMRELNEAMRANGIESVSADRQLKTVNQARITALKNQIADLDKQLRTGEKPKGRTPVPDSPEVERLRSERDAMQYQVRQLEAEANPPRTAEQIRLEADKKAIQTRIKKLEAKIASNDYAPTPKREPVTDKEKETLQFEYQKAREKYLRGLFEYRLKNRTTQEKVFGGITETLNTARAVMTSYDLSGLLRQAGFIAFAHPVRTAQAIPAMFRALRSEQGLFSVNNEIRKRQNAPLYKQAKLFIADENATSLSAMEEAYMSRWASKIPGVAGSQRAYLAILNRVRADAFDGLVATLGRNGQVTKEEARALANFVNVATGRGDLWKFQQAGVALNTMFFAPRYVASRFQLLLNPFTGFSLAGGGSARVRKQVALEYARALMGAAAVYALAMSAQEDDDEPIELDPRSSDFLKVRFGNTRLDPLAGLIQVTSLISRVVTGKTKTSRGEIMPIRGEVPYGKDDAYDVLAKFMRTKFAPVVGAAVDVSTGKNVVGEKVTPASAALGLSNPMSMGEIYETLQKQNIPKGVALGILAFFGFGVQTYSPDDR